MYLNPKTKFDAHITIDLEDFSYDLLRFLNLEPSKLLSGAFLEESYDKLLALLSDHQTNLCCTFFVTGNVAKRFPGLIKKIHSDGHEIASHGLNHVSHSSLSRQDFVKSLALSKVLLEDITSSSVYGFRAPMFSIDPFDSFQIETISHYYSYDSSISFSNVYDFENWKNSMEVSDGFELPVFSYKPFPFLPMYKTGGSYFKLLPRYLISLALEDISKSNLLPIIYLHPYDLLSRDVFSLSWNDFQDLPVLRRLYWYMRQHQWTRLGNCTVDSMLNSVFAKVTNRGCLYSSHVNINK